MERDQSNEKWTFERKKLLLMIRLKCEEDFVAKRRKRTALWDKVLKEIKEVEMDFPFSREDIYRKFLNFMITYKRIKKRNSTSGEASTSWEFFDIMDEVYGTRSCIVVPENILDSSISASQDIFLSNDESGTSTPTSSTQLTRTIRKRKNCEILEFLEKESEEDKKVLRELINIEKEKINVEKEKIKIMNELKEVLSSVLKSK